MAHGGDAVGHHEGQAVFVPLGIAGETVRVEVVEERKQFLRARLLEVISPSAERVAPPCPYFGRCGGCHWQHIAYPAQLRFKRDTVQSLLERTGRQRQPRVLPVLGMDTPWHYRNHVQLQRDAAGNMGYYALKSHEVVPVEHCLIAHPLLDELWGALDIDLPELEQVNLRAGIATGEQMVVLEGLGAPPELEVDLPVSCLWWNEEGEVNVLAGDARYREKLGEQLFAISGPSFFQVNSEQAVRLIDVVRQALALQPGERLLDAYCGVGTFGLSLAAQAGEVVGIESEAWAVADALTSAEESPWAERVTLYEGDVVEVLQEVPLHYDALVVDPPRAGLEPAALEALVQCGAQRWAYVSCDPATLARDVARLSDKGYRLEYVQPVDMFPQTYHVECVALLRKQQ
jgi:23S rRNA (uracil1939-C5)-methyltransferase